MAQKTDELIKALVREGVDFVIVGGFAANLHGSSYGTMDLDVFASLTIDNCRRILAALGEHTPRFYQSAGKPLVTRPAEQLAELKNLYLLTDLGVIDVLGSLPRSVRTRRSHRAPRS